MRYEENISSMIKNLEDERERRRQRAEGSSNYGYDLVSELREGVSTTQNQPPATTWMPPRVVQVRLSRDQFFDHADLRPSKDMPIVRLATCHAIDWSAVQSCGPHTAFDLASGFEML